MQKNDRNRLAIFDFCETLANYQTADAFVEFAEQKIYGSKIPFRNNLIRVVCKSRLLNILDKLKGTSLNKLTVLKRIKGISYDLLDRIAQDYYQTIVRPNLIPETLSCLRNHIKNGDRVILISGGYDVYLKYFAKEFSIKPADVYSTQIEYVNGLLTGRFVREDCIGLEKTKILDRYFSDYQHDSIAYSDSVSDKPMLNWAESRVLVLRSDRKPWDNFNKIIIWKKK